MNKIILTIGILLIMIFITGCYSKYNGVIVLDVENNTDCTIECDKQIKKYDCYRGSGKYQTTNINGQLINEICECLLIDCEKRILNED